MRGERIYKTPAVDLSAEFAKRFGVVPVGGSLRSGPLVASLLHRAGVAPTDLLVKDVVSGKKTMPKGAYQYVASVAKLTPEEASTLMFTDLFEWLVARGDEKGAFGFHMLTDYAVLNGQPRSAQDVILHYNALVEGGERIPDETVQALQKIREASAKNSPGIAIFTYQTPVIGGEAIMRNPRIAFVLPGQNAEGMIDNLSEYETKELRRFLNLLRTTDSPATHDLSVANPRQPGRRNANELVTFKRVFVLFETSRTKLVEKAGKISVTTKNDKPLGISGEVQKVIDAINKALTH